MPDSYVYIITNKLNGVLYVGVTSDLHSRVWQHKQRASPGFTRKYNLCKLVYFDILDDKYQAITREKQLKKWRRAWKIQLIEKHNPRWKDLYSEL
jgi:putative endonuclease